MRERKYWFADGLVATVRRASGGGGGQDQEEEEEGAFYRELELFGRLNHRHVVRLHGLSEGHNRFLVFDQMENRSLKECLHGIPLPLLRLSSVPCDVKLEQCDDGRRFCQEADAKSWSEHMGHRRDMDR